MADNDAIWKQILEMQRQNQQQLGQVTSLLAAFTASVNSNMQNRPTTEVLLDTLARSIDPFTPTTCSTFTQWYSKHESVFTKDSFELSDAARTRLLLRKLSQEAYDKYVNLILPTTPESLTFDASVEKLKSIFSDTKTQFQLRYDCLNVERQDNEDIVTYGARINVLCENFKISTVTPDQFKSLMFVIGLKSASEADLRLRTLALIEDETRNGNLNIEKLVTEAKRVQSLKSDAALIQKGGSVNRVVANDKKFKSDKKDGTPKTPCWGCGEMHYYKFCSYKEKTCTDCRKTGHKAGFCDVPRPKKNQGAKGRHNSKKKNVNHVVATTSGTNVQPIRKCVSVSINGTPVTLQLDSGSDFTIISTNLFNKIQPRKSRTPSYKAFDASSNSMTFIKEFDASVKFGEQHLSTTIMVTQNPHLNVLGADLMQKFGFFDRPINEVCLAVKTDFSQTIQREFPELFSDTPGLVDKFLPKLNLIEGSTKIFRAKRPVPFAVMKPVENELNRLVKLNIIEPVEYAEYAAPIVSVRKQSGSIRVCGDYATGLNDQLQPSHHPLPTREEILAKLSGATIFSKIDLSDAFLQIVMHPDSRKLLTINTHKGLFAVNRLAPGVKPAPGIFQEIMDTVLANVEGASPYIDDILIYASSQEQHDAIVRKVCKCLQEYGFRLKQSKCEFNKSQLKFLGCIVDATGTSPDPEKVAAIREMQAPTNLSQLRSVLGSINYHSRYIKNLRNIRAPLDDLTKQDVPWNWSPKCQQAFDSLKNILTSKLHLTHYDPPLPIIVSADASTTGLGAHLAHTMPDGAIKMVACSSRPLTSAEHNYSQIEKEGLALIFAVKTFHRYIFGRRFQLRTDHKPLLRIFGSLKGIPQHVANRLQRWTVILLAYDFEIIHIKTGDFGYVDMLSRLMQRFPTTSEDYVIAHIEADLSHHVRHVTQSLPLSYQQIAEATAIDVKLTKLRKIMHSGWPEKKNTSRMLTLNHSGRYALNLLRSTESSCLKLIPESSG